jgi:hypothetical protein
MFDVKRWNGSAWYNSLCSPYKTHADAYKHIKEYSWHYTKDFPAKIIKRGEEVEDRMRSIKIKLI